MHSSALTILHWNFLCKSITKRSATIVDWAHKVAVISGFLVFSFVSTFYVINFCLTLHNFDDDHEKVVSVTTGMAAMYRYYVLLRYYDDLEAVIDLIKDIQREVTYLKGYSEFCKKYALKIKLYGYTYFIIGIINAVAYVGLHLPDPNTKSIYQYSRSFSIPYKYIALILATYWYVGIAFIIYGYDALLLVLLLPLAAFYELLSKLLENIQDGLLAEDDIRGTIIYSVQLNIKLTRVCRKLEYIFEMAMIVYFLHLSFMMCMLMYTLMQVQSTSIANLAAFISILLQLIVTVGIYCFLGDHIKQATLMFHKKLYFGPWYESSQEMQKLTLMFMKIVPHVTLFKFRIFPMELPTLITILQTSYSFYSLLIMIQHAS